MKGLWDWLFCALAGVVLGTLFWLALAIGVGA